MENKEIILNIEKLKKIHNIIKKDNFTDEELAILEEELSNYIMKYETKEDYSLTKIGEKLDKILYEIINM